MRSTFLFFVVAPLLIACAYQGTIVQKASQPLPFAYSLGIDGSYKFALRDRLGHVRWQLVSAEVFHSYRVGDYFNDERPTPPRHRCYPVSGKEVVQLRPPQRNNSYPRPAFSADSLRTARGAYVASWHRCTALAISRQGIDATENFRGTQTAGLQVSAACRDYLEGSIDACTHLDVAGRLPATAG